MAKVKGPLLSQRAHGSIGDLITYQSRNIFQNCHRKATPTDRNSPAQISRREIFAAAILVWQSMTADEKEVYNAQGITYNNISGFNVFLKLKQDTAAYWAKFGTVLFGTTKKFGGP